MRGDVNLEEVARSVVEAEGLELVDVEFAREGGRRILRVTVDREGGVDLDAIANASERLSRRLDAADAVPGGRYALEVSSPGVERRLRAPRDFERSVGRKVKVRTAQPIDGARTHTGTLSEVGPEGATILTEHGVVRVGYADVTSARTIFEWGSRD
jgi:ribosome maturation factor RimP